MAGAVTYYFKGIPEVQKHLEGASQVINSEFNRAFQTIGGEFYRKFAPRLRGAGVRIKRRAKGQRRSPGKVSMSGIVRAAGFAGTVAGWKQLAGKQLRLRTSSPAMYAHEHGMTIRAKRARGMKLKVLTRAQARKAGQPKHKLPFFVRAGKVVIPARLGFYSTWGSYSGEIPGKLGKAVERAVTRLNSKHGGSVSASAQ